MTQIRIQSEPANVYGLVTHVMEFMSIEWEGQQVAPDYRREEGKAGGDLWIQGSPEFWGLLGKRVRVTVIIEEADDDKE